MLTRRLGGPPGQEMLAAHPADPLACHDLATAYNNVGDLLAKSGSVHEGLEVYRKGLAVCDWVSADDPASTQANTRGWEADFIKIGEMLTRLGNRKEAFENYDKAMSIAQRLSAADPQNAQAGSDLADCYESIGDSRLAFGEGTKALESYRQAIAVRERLYAKDGRNADVRADLASSYAQFGQAYAMLASTTNAQDPSRAERWREACSAYEKSLALLSEEPNRKVSDSWGNGERDIAARGRAKCDAALLELHGKR